MQVNNIQNTTSFKKNYLISGTLEGRKLKVKQRFSKKYFRVFPDNKQTIVTDGKDRLGKSLIELSWEKSNLKLSGGSNFEKVERAIEIIKDYIVKSAETTKISTKQ